MTDKQIEEAITDLMANQNSTNQFIVFQRLNSLLPKSENVSYENNLRGLIVIYLANPSAEAQISALQLLITCLKRGLFQSSKDLDLANVVVNIAHNTDGQDMEHQELWLRAYSALEMMNGLHLKLYEARTLEMVNITRRVIESKCSGLQKINALNMIEQLVKHVNLQNDALNTIVKLWVDHICPIVFTLPQNNLQTAAVDISYSMLPILQNRVHTECFNNFLTTVEKTYLPMMTNLVTKEDVLYSKLWIFLCNLLGVKFHQNFQVVNLLLTVVENGFKSQNIDMRLHAFYCWQSLIDSFLLNPDTFFTEKRFKLLTLPLKANNGRSENLVQVKFLTWCKLLNALDTKNISFDKHSVLEQFLQFCFGPLCEQSLMSWVSHVNQISQGKKYPSVHLMSCKALLQLFGMKKYIDIELQAKLEYFSFKNPKVCLETSNSKFIIDSVGECCVLLSQMQNSDRFECAAINEALWKSLFYGIEHLSDGGVKQKCCEQLATLILALTAVARKRTSLITFGLVPLFDIIISNEFTFFKNEKMSELLFIPMVQAVMKKDKALLQYDVIQIFRKIFVFKSSDADFLKFVQICLDRFALNVKENLHPDKLAMLQNVWLILEEELKKHLQKVKTLPVDEQMCSAVFYDCLMWPVTTLNVPFNQEKIYLKWKELFYCFGQTSATLENKLGIRILRALFALWEKGTHNVIIANITYFIVNNLKLKEYSEEQYPYIIEMFSLLKSFVLQKNLSTEILKIFVKSVKKTFSNSKTYPFCLKDEILDCVTCLLNTHQNTEILEEITEFLVNFPYTTKYKPEFEKLLHIIKSSNIEPTLLEPVINKFPLNKPKRTPPMFTRKKRAGTKASQSDSETLENRKRGRKSTFKSNEFPENLKLSKPTVDLIETNEKQQILKLLGHNVDTMIPVKLKGSLLSVNTTDDSVKGSAKDSLKEIVKDSVKSTNNELVFVSTPYKFDPHKLTKSQREKLSKKRDDIPALYADLSQSQTRDLCDSTDCTSLEITQNPFTELVQPNHDEPVAKTAALPELKMKIVGLLSSPEMQRNTIEDKPTGADVNLIQTEHQYQKSVKTAEEKKSKKERKTPEISKEKKKQKNNQPVIETAEGSKKKRGRKPNEKKTDNSIISENQENLEAISIERIELSDPLNTAQLDINSADLASETKPERKKRGRPFKRSSSLVGPEESDSNAEEPRGRRKRTASFAAEEPQTSAQEEPRGRRKRSASVAADEPQSSASIVSDTDAPDMSDIIKTRISRELKRIKMDIKDSEEYHKNEKRKTRTSINFQVYLEPEGRKSTSPVNNNNRKKTPDEDTNGNVNLEEAIKRTKSSPAKTAQVQDESATESILIIEATPAASAAPTVINHEKETILKKEEFIKQCKIPVLYRLESVKPGEHLIIDEKTDVIKGPKPTSPFKIFTPVVDAPKKSATCQEINFSELKEPEILDSSDTRTINSELLVEINEQLPEILNVPMDQPETDSFQCRKVLFDSSEDKEGSPPREPRSDIVTSPVCVDTPTRNRELIKDTLEISPIKQTPTENDIDKMENEKMELTSSSEPERVGNNSPHPFKFRKKSLKSPGGRSAHMMGMISARAVSPKHANKPKEAKEMFFSPTQNRIMKMMEHLEKEKNTTDDEEKPSEEVIKGEDIFVFNKELPSPFASPSASILKKRKAEDADAAALRACKRRRVNFSDPPVSSRKFIEKNAKQKFSSSVRLDFVPDEPRVTRRSSKSEITDDDTAGDADVADVTADEDDNDDDDGVQYLEPVQVEKTSNEVSVITKNSDFSAECLPDAQTLLDYSAGDAATSRGEEAMDKVREICAQLEQGEFTPEMKDLILQSIVHSYSSNEHLELFIKIGTFIQKKDNCKE